VRDVLEAVVKESHRADDVLKSVRAMFKNEPTTRTKVNLNELIAQVVSIAASPIKSKKVTLEINLTNGVLPLVKADPIQLHQAILNLVMNAVEAMERSGNRTRHLRIQTEPGKDGSIAVKIVDSGQPVDPEVIEKMFQPFFTSKPDGMGMGLSICKTIVEAHGGRMTATAKKPRGMEIQIILPLDRSA
jgi:signal transduction histidine kinase